MHLKITVPLNLLVLAHLKNQIGPTSMSVPGAPKNRSHPRRQPLPLNLAKAGNEYKAMMVMCQLVVASTWPLASSFVLRDSYLGGRPLRGGLVGKDFSPEKE